MALKQRDFQEGKLHPQLMTLPGTYHIMEFTYPAYLVKLGWCSDCSAEFHGTSINNQLHLGPELTSQIVGVLLDSGLKQWRSWLILKLCFIKSTSLKGKEAFLGTCCGRMLIWKNFLIMNCMYICLVAHHPLDTVIMLFFNLQQRSN